MSNQTQASFKVPRLRWIIALLLFLETTLNYIDLQTLSVVAPVITKEFHMTDGEYAQVTQAFLFAFTIMFLLGGWVIDKLGVRWGMALALVWWSVAEILHGFARTPFELGLCRFLFGFAYPGAYLAAAKLVSEWYPAQERGFATGIYTAGATVGATIAVPIVTYLSLSFGWRYAFFFPGGAGLVYLVIWLLIYRSPDKHPWLTENEKLYILADRGDPSTQSKLNKATLRSLFRDRRLWAVALGNLIGNNPWIFYVFWIPLFLNKQHHVSLKDIGFIGWIPFLFADIGSLGGGWISGLLIRRGWHPLRAGLLIMLVAACFLISTFFLGLLSSLPLIIGLLSLLMMCTMAWMVNLTTVVVDVFPPQVVATATGMVTFCTALGQFILTAIVGYCFDRHIHLTLFVAMSCLPPIAYIIFCVVADTPLYPTAKVWRQGNESSLKEIASDARD